MLLNSAQKISRSDFDEATDFFVDSDSSVLHSEASSRQAIGLFARLFDIVGASVALVVVSPFLLLVSFLLKVESREASLVYKKVRFEGHGVTRLLAFRTQLEGGMKASALGQMLLKQKLYMLPSILSVLQGQASLWGGRGFLSAEIDHTADRPFRLYADLLKRPVDILLVILASPLIGPAVLALLVIAKLDGGPAFFGHKRIGKNGETFRCWKIRSMRVDAEEYLKKHLAENPAAAAEWAENHKLEDDPRITKLGHVLRRTSLDEFPQFWNVLKGEMSLVGPRPIVADEVKKYREDFAYYKSVRPGVTGLWQVSGRNDISYDERVQLDVDYTKGIGFFFDLTIMFKTAFAMLDRTGK